jgi:dihydroorotate dehydrogenase
VEMMLAGATLVGIGSAIYRHGFKVIGKIKSEFTQYLKSQKLTSPSLIIGGAHS